jgi:CheY-like chemotaxis protein
LAIAKGLAELLGGKIGVKSKDGSGSTFWFTIPHQVADSGDSALENMENHQDETINPLILIVEDDPINIFLLETMLGKSKVTVWHVENGKLAVECCQNHPEISLVLMDLKMPDMDGFEATRRIKAIRKDLIIIAVTAFAMPGDKEQALDAGCDDYMSKPFSSTQLKDKLREFIRLTP